MYRTSINSRIDELRCFKGTLPEYEYKSRKESILRALSKLNPGSAPSLSVVKDPQSDKLLTTTGDIAGALTEHWQSAFSKRDTDHLLRERWLTNMSPCPHDTWELSDEEWTALFLKLHESSPGPDGIPFGTYKVLAKLVIPYFQRAFTSLLDNNCPWSPPEDFNFAFLYCIPKKADYTDHDLGDVYACGSTRPISVVNTDNRILANAINFYFSRAAAK